MLLKMCHQTARTASVPVGGHEDAASLLGGFETYKGSEIIVKGMLKKCQWPVNPGKKIIFKSSSEQCSQISQSVR
jgi:hypothetical protein